MIETLRAIIPSALERLLQQARADLPPLLAALAILLTAYLFARLARWLVTRIFKGIELDRWLYRSGFLHMFGGSGAVRASRIVAQTAYWGTLIVGFLAALNVFGTHLTTRIVEGVVFFFPQILAGGLILLVGLWLGQYLSRGMLVWAVNEDLPSPRKLAMAVRWLIVFVAVVVAADTLNFARGVFLAAFVIIVGGAVLAAALALGLGTRDAVQRYFRDRHLRDTAAERQTTERSLWNQL